MSSEEFGNWLGSSELSGSSIFDFDDMDFDVAAEDEDLNNVASDSDSGWGTDLDSSSGAFKSNGDDEECVAGENGRLRLHFQSLV